MLPRVLEPEVMDAEDDAREYDAMDYGGVNRAFVSDFLSVCPTKGKSKGEFLDLGTGTALIAIELCQRAPAARVLGVDLAPDMLALGQKNIDAAGLSDRIRLRLADAKKLPFADGQFPVVISNSIIHHIPCPTDVLAEATRVLAHGGHMFIRDLARPADDETVAHLVATYAAGAMPKQQKLLDDSLRAALNLEEIRVLVGALGFDPQGVNLTSDRHWTWSARKPGSGSV